MPPVNRPSDRWLANALEKLRADVAGLKSAQTNYITDAQGNAQAIIGNLQYDPNGNATGLSGFGIAVLVGSTWRSLAFTVGTSDLADGAVTRSKLDTAVISGFLQTVTSTAGLGIAGGVSSVTFSSSVLSATKSVAHGLSGTPIAVTTAMASASVGTKVNATAKDGTNITFQGDSTAVQSATFNFYWIAIG